MTSKFTIIKELRRAREQSLISNSNLVQVVGTTEEEVKSFGILKKIGGAINWSAMIIIVSLSTTNPLYAATLKIYIDDELTPRHTFLSNATTFEVIESPEIPIADLSSGIHTVRAKLSSADALATAYNKNFQVLLVRATS